MEKTLLEFSKIFVEVLKYMEIHVLKRFEELIDPAFFKNEHETVNLEDIQTITNTLPIGFFIFENNELRLVNQKMTELFDLQPLPTITDELLYHMIPVTTYYLTSLTSEKKPDPTVITGTDSSGKKISFAVFLTNYTYKSHQISFGAAIKLENNLTEKNMNLFNSPLLRNTYDIVGIFDTEDRILYKSPSFEKTFGYVLYRLLGTDCMQLIHPEDQEYVRSILTFVKDNPGVTFENEARIRHSNGHYLHCDVTITNYIHDPEIKGILVNYRDTSQIHEHKNKVKYLTNHDSLTHLPNRNFLNETIYSLIIDALEERKTFGVLYIDIDRFKKINVIAGHNLGDLLLKKITERLKLALNGHFVSRMGGEEFVALVQVESIKDVISISTNVIEAFKKPFQILNHTLFITVSIGISMYPEHGVNPTRLIQNADFAMNDAKKKGKNRFHVYAESLDHASLDSLKFETELRQSVDKEEFFLLYQPKINLSSRKVTGFESLIRWNNNKLGLVSPNTFIPIAEETGIIVEIGEWVLWEVCRILNLKRKLKESLVPISINISPKELLNNDIVKNVKNVLSRNDISPSWIEFEITESAIMHDIEDVKYKLNEFKKLGIKIAIDDFGTGYTSIGYLKKLPIDTLKIDQSYIKSLTHDNDYSEIVSAIISLANALKINTIAEGIENKEQLSILLKKMCKEGQGYLFSKPMPTMDYKKYKQSMILTTSH